MMIQSHGKKKNPGMMHHVHRTLGLTLYTHSGVDAGLGIAIGILRTRSVLARFVTKIEKFARLCRQSCREVIITEVGQYYSWSLHNFNNRSKHS